MGSAIEPLNQIKRQVREQWKASYPKDPGFRATASREICHFLLQQHEFKRAPRIAIFAGRETEIDLLSLFSLANRPFALPITFPQTKTLKFIDIGSPLELKIGNFGILEPVDSHKEDLWTSHDLILVPGVGFDLFGNRIGHGAGYYDRFFSKNPLPIRWGIGFHQQISNQELAHTHHDVRMGAIVTERGFFPAKKVEK